MTESASMTTADALRVIFEMRAPDDIVLTHQGSSREAPKLDDSPLNFHYVPSAMGAVIPLGLGLALAQPKRNVIAVTGDGSLLMNLGALVTVTAATAANLSVVLLDNARYAVTGLQRTAASDRDIDYAGMARAAGFPSVARCNTLDVWRRDAAQVLNSPGPRFVWLRVLAEKHEFGQKRLAPIELRVAEFEKALVFEGLTSGKEEKRRGTTEDTESTEEHREVLNAEFAD